MCIWQNRQIDKVVALVVLRQKRIYKVWKGRKDAGGMSNLFTRLPEIRIRNTFKAGTTAFGAGMVLQNAGLGAGQHESAGFGVGETYAGGVHCVFYSFQIPD